MRERAPDVRRGGRRARLLLPRAARRSTRRRATKFLVPGKAATLPAACARCSPAGADEWTAKRARGARSPPGSPRAGLEHQGRRAARARRAHRALRRARGSSRCSRCSGATSRSRASTKAIDASPRRPPRRELLVRGARAWLRGTGSLPLAGAAAPGPPSPSVSIERLKPLFPIPALLVILAARLVLLPPDLARARRRGAPSIAARCSPPGKIDYRPLVALRRSPRSSSRCRSTTAAAASTTSTRARLLRRPRRRSIHGKLERRHKFDELFGFGWWATARVVGYVVVPFALWKLFFPQRLAPRLRASGRKGFLTHAWIYLLFLAVVLPAMFIVSRAARLRRATTRSTRRLAELARLPPVGGDVLRAVLRARDVLPRLLARRRCEELRLGRHLRDGRALLHDPLRQAVPRSATARSSRASRSARSA